MKYLLSTLTMIMAFGMLTVAIPDLASAGSIKVDVCHIPPGNPENFHTIRISENALAAHLDHGDFASACNALCTTLCNDSDACTVDDTLDCEERGCPSFPRDQVDISDSLACTIDSCDSSDGVINTPIECFPSDLCHVSACVEPGGQCVETEKVCADGEVCNLENGECESECATPVISDIMIAARSNSSVRLSWETDVPATSQIYFRVGSVGSFALGADNQDLVTDHSLEVSGLASNTIYQFFLRSEMGDCVSADSALITVRTSR